MILVSVPGKNTATGELLKGISIQEFGHPLVIFHSSLLKMAHIFQEVDLPTRFPDFPYSQALKCDLSSPYFPQFPQLTIVHFPFSVLTCPATTFTRGYMSKLWGQGRSSTWTNSELFRGRGSPREPGKAWKNHGLKWLKQFFNGCIPPKYGNNRF